jgi:hypothetical protein
VRVVVRAVSELCITVGTLIVLFVCAAVRGARRVRKPA